MIITSEIFKRALGYEPHDDDLERCNCAQAGQMFHACCGWDEELNLPTWIAMANKIKNPIVCKQIY